MKKEFILYSKENRVYSKIPLTVISGSNTVVVLEVAEIYLFVEI